jgi:hypothetical protein
MKRKQRKHPYDPAIKHFEERAAFYGAIAVKSRNITHISIAARTWRDAAHAAALLRSAK